MIKKLYVTSYLHVIPSVFCQNPDLSKLLDARLKNFRQDNSKKANSTASWLLPINY